MQSYSPWSSHIDTEICCPVLSPTPQDQNLQKSEWLSCQEELWWSRCRSDDEQNCLGILDSESLLLYLLSLLHTLITHIVRFHLIYITHLRYWHWLSAQIHSYLVDCRHCGTQLVHCFRNCPHWVCCHCHRMFPALELSHCPLESEDNLNQCSPSCWVDPC